MIQQTKVVYIAKDGKEFDNPDVCKKYEETLYGKLYSVVLTFKANRIVKVRAKDNQEAIERAVNVAKYDSYPEDFDIDCDTLLGADVRTI